MRYIPDFFFFFFFKEEERKTTPMFPQDVIKLDSLTEVAEREDAHHLVKMQETIIVFGRFRIWLTQLFSSFILSLKLIIFSRQTKKEEDKRRLGVTITTTQPWQDGRLLMLKNIYIYHQVLWKTFHYYCRRYDQSLTFASAHHKTNIGVWVPLVYLPQGAKRAGPFVMSTERKNMIWRVHLHMNASLHLIIKTDRKTFCTSDPPNFLLSWPPLMLCTQEGKIISPFIFHFFQRSKFSAGDKRRKGIEAKYISSITGLNSQTSFVVFVDNSILKK